MAKQNVDVACGAIYTQADKLLEALQNVAYREAGRIERVGMFIANGQIREARRLYERHKSWMTLPTSALNVLYPDN